MNDDKTCPICGKKLSKEDLENKQCPICDFDIPYYLGEITFEQAMKSNEHKFPAKRDEFLNKINIGVKAYFRKENKDKYELSHEKLITIGTGKQLYGKEVWSEVLFARDPSHLSDVVIDVEITKQDEEQKPITLKSCSVKIPTDIQRESSLLQVGATINDKMEIRYFVGKSSRNADSEKYESDYQPMFE